MLFRSFPGFSVPTTVDSVIGIEGVIDVLSQSDPLPAWWRLDPLGCRANALSGLVPGSTGCADPFGGTGSALVQAYRVSPETPATNQARIVFTASVLPSRAVRLDPGVPYIALDLALDTRGTIGTNACSGCSSAACLVLNSITLLRASGAGVASVVLSDPTATTNWAYWQGRTGLDCALVPARARTWGAIKSLYR